MRFRNFLLFAALALAACDASDSSNNAGTFDDAETKPPVTDSTKTTEEVHKVKTEDEVYKVKTPEEAYRAVAPADYKLDDPTVYSGEPGASLEKAVDEKPAVRVHSLVLNGETVWYTASAGHLTAYAKNPAREDPQASIFYTAYTRDDLKKSNRPVTFFFNGGPGASSVYLHMGSFAPMRAFTDGPKVPKEWQDRQPESFPLVEDKESLLDKTDLVFVDIIPGSGYSQAIAPYSNKTFWGVKVDVELSRQFVTRYINVNNRQASPKYLYGESYGGGTRVPKLARALLEAGTSGYEADPSGSKPSVLSGVVFHSPAFANPGWPPLEHWFPTIVMAADTYGRPHGRDNLSLEDYAESIRTFLRTDFAAAEKEREKTYILSDDYLATPKGKKFETNFHKFVGDWPNVKFYFVAQSAEILGVQVYNAYDARMSLPKAPDYSFSFYDDPAMENVVSAYLPDFIGYKANSRYIGASWDDNHHPTGRRLASELWNNDGYGGLQDIVAALGFDPSLKLLTVHGYYDSVTPFYESETDLQGVVLDPVKKTTLLDRIPVKNFAGGHMIYYSEEARAPLKKTLAEFYDAPPYGSGAPSGLPLSRPVLFALLPNRQPAVALH